jgi:hypothetical protein
MVFKRCSKISSHDFLDLGSAKGTYRQRRITCHPRQFARSPYAIRVSLCRASRAYSASPIASLAAIDS